MLEFSIQNKLRINLCCNCPDTTKFGSTYVAIFHKKQTSDQPTLKFSTQNKIRINLCWTLPHKTNSDQPMLQFSTQNKIRETCPMWGPASAETRKYIRIYLCWTFVYKKKKKKFGSSYIAIVLTKRNSDQPILQFSTQNKIRINLCWNFPHKTKLQSMLQFSTQNKIATYVAIFHTKQNCNLCCNFPHKRKFGSTSAGIFQTNKIRINLCCNFPHQTKFEKRALVCEDLFQLRLVSTFLIILGSQDRTPFSKSNNG